MKLSSKFAAGAGSLTAAIGIGAAFLCPLAGLAAGAYFTYTAVAATMALPAVVALSAAGAVGGLVVGRIATPIVALGSVALGGLVGLVTKGIGSGIGMVVNGVKSLFGMNDKSAPSLGRQHMRTFEESSQFDGARALKGSFQNAGVELANENRKAPKPQSKLFRRFSL